MDTVTRVRVLDEAVCISFGANTFGKGMHPNVLTLLVNSTID